jgi:hypothetical protein
MKFKRGDKVIFEDATYDFGYISNTGRAVIYEEGEQNLQDAMAVDPKELSPKMVYLDSWEGFQSSGLLWWTNRMLHLFGWAIVYECEGDKIINVYPARVKFRGFCEKEEDKGFKNLSDYMVRAAKTLRKECDD